MEQLFIALVLLAVSTRSESRDHAFGDREVFWDLVVVVGIGVMEFSVASGYFGSGTGSIWFEDSHIGFDGDVARDLAKLGGLGVIDRNDETGPSSYSEGVTMPGLTLEGVAEELGFVHDPDEDGVCYHENSGETHLVDQRQEALDDERDLYFLGNQVPDSEVC